MEYMRGLLRDNDLFRAYITVRASGARRGPGHCTMGSLGRQMPGGVGGALSPAPPPRRSGPRSTSSASG